MSDETKRLLMTYTVLNSDYGNAKLRRIEGISGGPDVVDYPTDTGYGVADASDPMVYSYMSTNANEVEEPHILVVRTQAGSPQATTYTVLRPTLDPAVWVPLKEGIKFTLNGASVLGNPQSLAQVKDGNNRFIYLVDFDSSWVYGINVAHFEAYTATTYPLDPLLCLNLTTTVDPVDEYTSHGISIIALQGVLNSPTSHTLFALYMAVDSPWVDEPDYDNSRVVKLSVSSAGTPSLVDGPALVGLNATGLVPVSSGSDISILVPAIGGKQHYGINNGPDSVLDVVLASSLAVSSGLIGGDYADPDDGGPYDIRMAATSADGDHIYVLTGTFTTDFNMCWRLYEFGLSDLDGRSLTVADHAIDSGARALGYYWSVLYETSAGDGERLWFVKGSPIQITVGTDYSSTNRKEIRIGEDELGGTNVNSVDLTGEMVALAATDKAVNTLLRAYQPPHVVSGAFRSMADFIRHEKVKKLHQERLEKKRGKRKDKQGASKVVSLQPKDITLQPKLTAPKLTVSIDPKVLKAKIDVTVSFDSRDASPKIEVTAAR